MNLSSLIRRLFQAVYRCSDLLMLAVLLFLAGNYRFAFSKVPLTDYGLNFLDDSWQLDLGFKAQHGIWLGRDVLFTYGPLFQWLATAFARFSGFSSGALLKTWPLFYWLTTLILIYLTGRLLLFKHAAWKRLFYFSALSVFWAVGDIRDLVVLVLLSFFLVELVKFSGFSRLERICLSFATGAVLGLSFLISFDTGVYSVIGFCLSAFFFYLYHDHYEVKSRPIMLFYGAAAAWFTVCILVINLFATGHLFRFSFWSGGAEILRHYRWFEASAMTHQTQVRFLAGASIFILVFVIAWIKRDMHSTNLLRQPFFLATAFFLSLLCFESSLVRSDWGHVAMGMFPAIALSGAILMGSDASEPYDARGNVPVFIALALTLGLSGANGPFAYDTFRGNLAWYTVRPSLDCPAKTYFLDDLCLEKGDFEKLTSVTRYIAGHTQPQEPLLVFPYENVYGVISKRKISGGVLQNYVVAGDLLLQRQLAGFERDKPSLAVFTTDGPGGTGAWPVDGVPNFTRNPEIWFYLQSHYQKEDEVQPGILILRRNEQRQAKWHLSAQDLLQQPFSQRMRKKVDVLIKIRGNWPDDIDFLRLQITVHYAPWWKIRKPSQLSVKVTYTNGDEKVIPTILEPNRPFDLWIYPWQDEMLRYYFQADASEWRKAWARPAISQISLRCDRLDWISVFPSGITVEKLEGVRLDLKEAPSAPDLQSTMRF